MTLPPFPAEVSAKLQEIALGADMETVRLRLEIAKIDAMAHQHPDARRAADFMRATARARDEAVARIRDLAATIDLS